LMQALIFGGSLTIPKNRIRRSLQSEAAKHEKRDALEVQGWCRRE
jgi:hypothetical protein